MITSERSHILSFISIAHHGTRCLLVSDILSIVCLFNIRCIDTHQYDPPRHGTRHYSVAAGDDSASLIDLVEESPEHPENQSVHVCNTGHVPVQNTFYDSLNCFITI